MENLKRLTSVLCVLVAWCFHGIACVLELRLYVYCPILRIKKIEKCSSKLRVCGAFSLLKVHVQILCNMLYLKVKYCVICELKYCVISFIIDNRK